MADMDEFADGVMCQAVEVISDPTTANEGLVSGACPTPAEHVIAVPVMVPGLTYCLVVLCPEHTSALMAASGMSGVSHE